MKFPSPRMIVPAKRTCLLLFLSLMAAVLCAGCDTEDDTGENPEVFFLFAIRNVPPAEGHFVAKTTLPAVIEVARSQLALPADERNLHINGTIARGSDGYNLEWNWHFVPDEWALAQVSIEVCDGLPQMVADDRDYWVDVVGQFCPWDAYVFEEIDP
ncbi:hypothetical protein GF339_03510 [candidate division KSB3 bacterium]|uniref:BP74 N-terminal domain-containing protein n=1 Tax=candidate division KSB3 bacterium TaxID=2044937 RepID=A0A9D5Q4J6_9BACT|nr:hypothetical protein [candidate division KSB3 bacterium]MBD3323625.1 hypothetical protein [candidate division KSB3 bacterium]